MNSPSAMPGLTGLTGLAGRLRLHPGAGPAQAALHSSRADWLPRFVAGRLAEPMPELLGAAFSLCAHAQRSTARRALAAARGSLQPLTEMDRQAQRLAALREQVLRIGHDWPRLLPGEAAALAAPEAARAWQDSPLQQQAGSAADVAALLAAWRHWLQQHWLGCSPAQWLAHWAADPAGWPLHWATHTPLVLPQRLLRQAAACLALATPGPTLDLGTQADITMPLLARLMATEPGFCLQPHWQGEHPDTGPWQREGEPLMRLTDTAWHRLLARLADLLRLVEPGGEQRLGLGACRLGPGAGMAWAETARGLLVHRVQLAAPAGAPVGAPVGAPAPEAWQSPTARVADWRVLAPTEWNCHPQGALANALRRLAPGAADDAARLAVAFDPCVEFEIAGAPPLGEDEASSPGLPEPSHA